MSNTSDTLTDLHDDDVLILFRAPDGQGRRKAVRTTGAKIKQAILAAQPVVAGPKGDKGDPGVAGKDGASIAGPKGDVGPTGSPGKSAYELALASGYSGTQAQWLASLKGATGQTGAAGNKITVGSGAPTTIGVSGDLYVDTSTWDVYSYV